MRFSAGFVYDFGRDFAERAVFFARG